MAAGSEPSRLLLGPDNAKHPVRLRPPPGFVATLKRIPLFHILMFISFFVSGVFVNFCQLILWLTVRPLSLDGYRRVNKHLNYAIWSQITFLFEWWSSMKIILESRAPSHAVIGNRNGLILMNHSYGIDGPVSWAIADHYGILGNAKVLAKKELLFAPVIGWSWFFAEVLFMERDWTKDHFVLEERVGSLCSWPEPFWLLLYPEGTRFTRQKHAAAVEFARSKNLPVFKHLLQPRPKGFQFLRRNIKDHVKDVYDVLMVFEDDRESQRSRVNLASLLRGEPSVCRVFMRHYKIEEIPEDEEGAKGWLMDRFVEKDALFDHFKKHGEFLPEEEKREQNVVAVPMRRTWSSLLNILFWFGAVHSYIWSHVISSLLDGSYVLPGIFVALIFAASYGMDRMVGLTSMKKSSSYGVKPSSGAVRENADAQNAAAKPGAQPVVANNS